MTVSRRLARSMIVALLLLCGVAPRHAALMAAPSSSAALAMRDDEIRVVNAILAIFAEAMDRDERGILQDIDVRIPMDYDVTRVVAYRDNGRVIEISFGFYGTMIELCDNWILSEYYSAQDPGIYEKYDAYLTYLNQAIDRNEQAPGQEVAKLQHFAEFAGIPTQTAAQILARSDAKDYDGRLRMAAIAFVLAHEIGHHMLGHVDSPAGSAAESRNREAQADRYAASLTMRAGIPAFGALPALAFFAGAEVDRADPDATHPLAACRILRAMMYTVDRLAEDQRSAPLFENAPSMRPGGSQYNTLLTQMNEHCR